MGRRGPAPQPTAMKKLRGNPGKRALNSAEPKPDSRMPDPPQWLIDMGKDSPAWQLWQTLAPQLHQMGVLTLVDGGSFSRYCQIYDEWRRAVEKYDADGRYYETESGAIMTHPAVHLANKLSEQMLRLEQQFGLTPSARSNIKVDAGEGEDPLAKFAQQGVNLRLAQ